MDLENLEKLNEAENLAVEVVKHAIAEKERMLDEARLEAEKILKSAEQRVSVYEWREKENLKKQAEREIGSFHDNSDKQKSKLHRMGEARIEDAARAVVDEVRKGR